MLDYTFAMEVLDAHVNLTEQFVLLKRHSMFQKAVDGLSNHKVRVDETLE